MSTYTMPPTIAQPLGRTGSALLTLDQAAEVVGFSTKTLRRAIAQSGPHRLRAAKVRGRWRIRAADLDAWVDRYMVRAVR